MGKLPEVLRKLRGTRSLRDVSKRAGISHNYLRNLEMGIDPRTKAPIHPSPDTLRKLAVAYDYPYEELLKLAGYLDNGSDNESFGSILKKIRVEKGFTVNQLAMYSGVSAAQISRIENSKRGVPKPETIKKLADALKYPYEQLMEEAGYINGDSIPAWATKKDVRDFRKMLEEETLMFDGMPLDEEDKEKILRVVEAVFWDAKKKNKRKPIEE